MMFDLGLKTKVDFDADLVSRHVTTVLETPLQVFAELVQETARDSIKPARRMDVNELSPKAQQRFALKTRLVKQKGRPVPVLPFVHSQPGQPPLSPSGKLARSILFEVDPEKSVAVIGAVKLANGGLNVPSILEFGDGHSAARPFMGPALKRSSPKFVQLFEEIF
jgi:hypothetical protein